jgi:hypothetical protein
MWRVVTVAFTVGESAIQLLKQLVKANGMTV